MLCKTARVKTGKKGHICYLDGGKSINRPVRFYYIFTTLFRRLADNKRVCPGKINILNVMVVKLPDDVVKILVRCVFFLLPFFFFAK